VPHCGARVAIRCPNPELVPAFPNRVHPVVDVAYLTPNEHQWHCDTSPSPTRAPTREATLQIELGVCAVREWRLADARILARHSKDHRVRRSLGDEFWAPSTLYAAARFILWMRSMRPPTCFAITAGDEPVGGIGYRLRDGLGRSGAEIGYWVSVSWWGRGIATAALKAITAHAFRSWPELGRLYALCSAGNPASARVLQKVGYRLEGRLRRSAPQNGIPVDQLLYAILREDGKLSDGMMTQERPRG
jgi:ribosomal-protein-alanine N-acetyltransferase